MAPNLFRLDRPGRLDASLIEAWAGVSKDYFVQSGE